MAHELPPLPYAHHALEPFIDVKTMEIHHGKHHLRHHRGRGIGETAARRVFDSFKGPWEVRVTQETVAAVGWRRRIRFRPTRTGFIQVGVNMSWDAIAAQKVLRRHQKWQRRMFNLLKNQVTWRITKAIPLQCDS